MAALRAAALLAGILLPAALAAAGSEAYVFTYFIDNGEDGLHLAGSADGYTWEALHGGRSFLAPAIGRSKLMRDPCVVRGPDGRFRMVWTTGWGENDIGYASSPDLMHWSRQQEIPVMAAEPTVLNSWAPEIHWDPKRREFIIFWSSTIPGRFPATDGSSGEGRDHRIYFTTTKDFQAFAPTKLLFDPGYSVIDATFLHANGRHYLIFKDETLQPVARKCLQMAESDDVQGPFSPPSPPFSPPGLWSEGPTAIKIGPYYVVYFDAYKARHYGAMRSRDLKTWEDATALMHFPNEGTPARMRHGTVIAIPAEIAAGLAR